VKDLDPSVERVILRCLEQDPKRRPSSALSVAMALPGGDPIAAALAAGERPSPEMVAASSEKEGFSARTAWLCFAAIVILAIPDSMFNFDSRLWRIARLDIPPEALAFKSEEILKQFGYGDPPKNAAYGFDCCNAANLSYANRLSATQRDAVLASHQPPVVSFWYRRHQDILYAEPTGSLLNQGAVTSDSPTNTEPGMIRTTLDPRGRLIELDARPADEKNGSSAPLDWAELFSAAGLDLTRFTATAPQQLPPMPFDARAAWIGTYAEGRSETVRVEAAAWQGRPAPAHGFSGGRVCPRQRCELRIPHRTGPRRDAEQHDRIPSHRSRTEADHTPPVVDCGHARLYFFGLTGPIDFSTPYFFFLSAASSSAFVFALLWLIRRFGFVAVQGFWPVRVLIAAPLVWGTWYMGRGLVAQMIPIAVAAWALWVIVSTQRRPAMESAHA
jgi:hypothetical protein